MQALLDANPDAQPYADMVHNFLWGSLSHLVLAVAIAIMVPRLIGSIMSGND